jgi:outer membrane protein assembly factor BamB
MRHSLRPFAFLLAAAVCTAGAARADDWPGWLGPHRDGVWRETGLVDKFPEGGPRVLWRAPVGSGYSGPAVAGDRVYLMDRQRPLGPDGKPQRPTRAGHPGNERVLCLDAATGKVVWEHAYDCPYTVSYPSGPRTTPLVRDGKVWTLGAMGDLLCLDAAAGNVIWSKNLAKEYQVTAPPVWGYSASPLVDGDLLYTLVGGDGATIVALNKDTGREVWKASLKTEEVGYSPPVIYEAGGKRQLMVWLSESLNALDPATGAVYWTQQYPLGRAPQRPSVNIVPVVRDGDRLFVSTVYHGGLMLKLDPHKPGAAVVWRAQSKDPLKPDPHGLNVLMAAPVIKGGYVYGVSEEGQLRCLNADTGKMEWESLAATGGKKSDCGSAFLVPQGDRFVIFNDQGELILADLSPKGYREISRARIVEPVQAARGRHVVWSHPAFAHKCVFARNDKELVCVSLAAPAPTE